jgi:UDP-2,3-diacylglucosamine hydrolase
MFSRRSTAERYLESIEMAAMDSDTFVFNGDIFDFKWSDLISMEQTIHTAIAWLRELLMGHPNCHFHFVLGNHDTVSDFVAKLRYLEQETTNLSVHETFVRIGGHLFLHGDAATTWMTHARWVKYREKCAEHTQIGGVRNFFYDVVVAGKLHLPVPFLVSRRASARKLMHYLEDAADEEHLNGVDDIYFGHTHRPFTGFEYDGMRFHNTGSTIRGMVFNMIRFDYDPDAPVISA